MKVVDGPGWRRLELSGEIDLAWYVSHRPDVERTLQDMPPLVFVDVERVTFLDSTGLGILVQLYRQSQQVHGEVYVVCPRPFVARTLEIAGLDEVLTIVTSPAEAEGNLRSTGSTGWITFSVGNGFIRRRQLATRAQGC